jgi:diaminopimelate epimerase
MRIPFIKAQGAGNDFLFSFAHQVAVSDYAALARAICHRSRGVGADGWYLIDFKDTNTPAEIKLWNSDGSYAELSGNGTRCAAAILVARYDVGPVVTIVTGSGPRRLTLLERNGDRMRFEMEVGEPMCEGDGRQRLMIGGRALEVTVVDVGNPQCSLPVETLDFDWKGLGAEIEGNPAFPERTNVSFFKVVNEHTIEARFYERGAGATLSSGTGSTGAAVAAIVRKLVKSPVTVRTEDEPLEVRWEGTGQGAYLIGPAQIVATGTFHFG